MTNNYHSIDLINFLIENGFVENGDINIYDNSNKFYFKYPIVIIFNNDERITIKDLLDNRKYDFKLDTSDYLLVEFIKYLEKDTEYHY